MPQKELKNPGRKFKINRVRSLVSGMLFNGAIGIYYIYGGLNPVIYNYLKNNGNPDIEPEDGLIVHPMWLISQSLFAAVGIKIAEKIGFGALNWIAHSCYVMVFLATSYLSSFYGMVYFFSIAAGICCGLGFLNGVYIAWTYFPKHKGFAAGCIFMSAGVSGAAMSFLTTKVLNPVQGLKPSDPEMYERVPMMFRAIAIFYAANTLIAGTIQPETYESPELKDTLEDKKSEKKSLKSSKKGGSQKIDSKSLVGPHLRSQLVQEDARNLGEAGPQILNHLDENRVADLIKQSQISKSLKDSGDSKLKEKLVNQNSETGNPAQTIVPCASLKDGMKSTSFLCIATMAICSSMYNYFFNSAWKNYGYTFLTDVSEQEFAVIISAASICNSLARLIIGILMSKFSFRTLYMVIVGLEIFTSLTLTTFATGYWVYMLYVCVAMFCLGSHITMFPTLATKTFGIEVGRKIYPYFYQCFSVASLIQYFIYKRIPKDNIDPLFYIFGGLCLIAFTLNLFFTEVRDWREKPKNKNRDSEQRPRWERESEA